MILPVIVAVDAGLAREEFEIRVLQRAWHAESGQTRSACADHNLAGFGPLDDETSDQNVIEASYRSACLDIREASVRLRGGRQEHGEYEVARQGHLLFPLQSIAGVRLLRAALRRCAFESVVKYDAYASAKPTQDSRRESPVLSLTVLT